ncbi:MAG: TonB dependent receptor [Chitinophagaceae bacterium]|nr:TonB dependent receptor [Chitinophagaceae bacterium]
MRIIALLLVLLLSLTFSAQSQSGGSVKGLVYDTLAKRPVQDATVTLLSRRDSSLVSFSMTDNAGRFSISNIPSGDYRLLITHVAYHNNALYFSVNDSIKNHDLGNIVANDRTKVLEEVIVKNEAPPVTLVGDTIQYNAGSFKTPPNASVEQLLKKLPGVQVDREGNIKAQGESVKKVLVDGKEFFGTDPKMATKNLPADAIDKVQVYDRKSDQSQLTGFDDGNSEKTINLKLKEDKKKGSFGKIMAGAGTDNRKEGRFNVNSFKGARQMSVIGMGNNTNAEGFSFMDMMNFSGELSRMMRGGGGNISSTDMSSLSGANNQGIRTIWGGGCELQQYHRKKVELTSNYFYNHTNPRTITDRQRQYLLRDSSYFDNRSAITDNKTNSHRLNLGIDYVIDSFHSIKWNPSIGYQQSDRISNSDYTQTGSDGRLSNAGYSNTYSGNTAFNWRNDLLFRKKFRKKGRTLSLSLQTTLNNSAGDGSQESVNEFYNPQLVRYRTDSINQRYQHESDLKGISSRLVYTEPLFRNSLLEMSVGNSYTKSTSNRTTFDYDSNNGKYDQLNDSLSNDFKKHLFQHQCWFKSAHAKEEIQLCAGS